MVDILIEMLAVVYVVRLVSTAVHISIRHRASRVHSADVQSESMNIHVCYFRAPVKFYDCLGLAYVWL